MPVVVTLTVFGILSVFVGFVAFIGGLESNQAFDCAYGTAAIMFGLILCAFATGIKKLYDIDLRLQRANRHAGITTAKITCVACSRTLSEYDLDRGNCPGCKREVALHEQVPA